jgi:hypothetical protein
VNSLRDSFRFIFLPPFFCHFFAPLHLCVFALKSYLHGYGFSTALPGLRAWNGIARESAFWPFLAVAEHWTGADWFHAAPDINVNDGIATD